MIKHWIISLGISGTVIWIVWKFVAFVYVVHGSSMEPSFNQGDMMLVRPSSSPFFNPPKAFESVLITNVLETNRVKRVIGLPGDTLIIKDFERKKGDFFALKKPYWVKVKGKQPNWLQWGIQTAVPMSTKNDWLIGLTPLEKQYLLKTTAVQWAIAPPSFAMDTAWYISQINGWTQANFGPLVVPSQSSKLVLTPHNWNLYQSLIVTENKGVLDSLNQTMKTLGRAFYQPAQDYYFVMGDNRGLSVDSRDFGFVSLGQIQGIVMRRLFSSNRIRITNPLVKPS